eukprot:SAG11_NODE_20766_length_438_cov_2.085546_2_plen_59_part_01
MCDTIESIVINRHLSSICMGGQLICVSGAVVALLCTSANALRLSCQAISTVEELGLMRG